METKNATTHQALAVRLEPNMDKIIAAISYLIASAGVRDQNLTQYDIVKTLFLADRKHLNEYGRPITFDNYYAMPYGPVPNLAYDFLKGNKRVLQKYGKALPWTTKKGPHNKLLFSLRGKPEIDALSSSDKEALESALMIVGSLSFSQIVNLTHNDLAYSQAWASKEEDSQSAPMNLAFLFDTPNMEAAQQLAFISKHQ